VTGGCAARRPVAMERACSPMLATAPILASKPCRAEQWLRKTARGGGTGAWSVIPISDRGPVLVQRRRGQRPEPRKGEVARDAAGKYRFRIALGWKQGGHRAVHQEGDQRSWINQRSASTFTRHIRKRGRSQSISARKAGRSTVLLTFLEAPELFFDGWPDALGGVGDASHNETHVQCD
jgi:hypothetical protein